jgi:hypothetical protein
MTNIQSFLLQIISTLPCSASAHPKHFLTFLCKDEEQGKNCDDEYCIAVYFYTAAV